MSASSSPARSAAPEAIERRVVVWALLSSMLWGTSYVAAKFVVQSVPPITAAAFRFLVVAVVLWITVPLAHQEQKVERGDWKWLALAGLFQTTIYFALQYAGINLTTASNTAVIVNARPIFAAILAYFFLREALTSRKIAGIILAFIGVVILTTEGSLTGVTFHSQYAWGNFLIVLNALSGAIGLVLTRKVLSKYRPFTALVYVQSFGALGLIPLAAIELVRAGGLPHVAAVPWLVLVYQAVFCSIFPHLLWNNVLARVEASRAAVFIYLTPVMSTILSYFLLGENISIYFVIGSVLILGGAYVTMLPGRVAQVTETQE